MNLHHLRSFVTVIEHGSVSGAARELSLTPASVSAHIHSLETEFAIELFIRTNRGVELTPTGRTLEQRARRTLEAANNFAAQAESLSGRVNGRLRLALSISAELFSLSTFVAEFCERFPGVEVRISREETTCVLESIKQNRLEIGIVYGSVDDPALCAQKIGQAELVICVPRTWADKMDFSWPALGDLNWIYTGDDCPFLEPLRELFAARNIQVQKLLRSDDDRTRLQLVSEGLGVSLLERSEAEHPEVLMIDAEPLHCSISLVTQTHRQFEPVIKAARQLILGQITK